MIKEVARAKTGALWVWLVLAAAFTACIFALAALAAFVQARWGVAHPEYAIYVLLLVLGAGAFVLYSTQYHYRLVDEELILEKRCLGRSRRRTAIYAAHSLRCLEYRQLGRLTKAEKRGMLRYDAAFCKKYYLVIPAPAGRRIVAFTPSPQLLAALAAGKEVQHER